MRAREVFTAFVYVQRLGNVGVDAVVETACLGSVVSGVPEGKSR